MSNRDPVLRRAYNKRYLAANGDRVRARQRAYRQAHPEIHRKNTLQRYGLTEDGFASLLREQGGACAICEWADEVQPLDVDHDHATGTVRGLLCRRCNTAIGSFLDDPQLLLVAAGYLLRPR